MRSNKTHNQDFIRLLSISTLFLSLFSVTFNNPNVNKLQNVAHAQSAYTLKSPVPSPISLPHVIQGRQSYAQQHIMWRNNQGQVNIVNAFGGSDVRGDEKAFLHYINTATGTSKLVEGGPCSLARMGQMAYSPTHNKFYWSGAYCNRTLGGSFNEFDPVTMTNTVIETGVGKWWNAMAMVEGFDNKIYFIPMDADGQGGHLYSYNPTVGKTSWSDLGVIYDSSNGISPGLYVDNNYVYVAWQQKNSPNYWHLMIRPTGPGSWSEYVFADGLPSSSIGFSIEKGTGKWVVTRTPLGGTSQYYWPENGSATSIAIKPAFASAAESNVAKYKSVASSGDGDYALFVNAYNYDMNWDDLIPNPSKTTSTVHYGPHSTWNYPTSGFSTATLEYQGPWYDLSVGAVVPRSGEKSFYGISSSISDYNYGTLTGTPIYMQELPSVYHSLLVPASISPLGHEEVYISGYANQFWRWDPTKPWSTTNPRAISFPQHMNYRVFADYDAEGKIWTGSNMCGATAGCVDYGSVAWYDPKTEQKGEMFQGVWTGGNPPATGNGIKYINLALSNNRTKVVVSSNDNKLTVINALTKTIEGSYDLGNKAFLIEVAEDRVLGVTKSDLASEVFLFRPSTRTMIMEPRPINVTGQTFGTTDGSAARRGFKLERGADGYVWLYVDSKIHRINPETLAFEYVATDASGSRKLIWANNNKDLIVYGNNTPAYYPGLLIGPENTPSPSPTPTPIPGDSNGDRLVNGTDYVRWLINFGKATTNGAVDGDYNGDGNVSGTDYVVWLNNYTFLTSPSPTPTATPLVTPSPTPVVTATPSPTPSTSQQVVSLTLINASTDQDIMTLTNGTTISFSSLGTSSLNVRANTNPATVGSVRFGLDANSNYKTETDAPYALGGDVAGNYNNWTPSVGSHTITATPYTGASATGTAGTPLTVNFTVTN